MLSLSTRKFLCSRLQLLFVATCGIISTSPFRLFHSSKMDSQQRSTSLRLNYHELVSPPSIGHQVIDIIPSKLIIVGDVHGCLDELHELLTKCEYDPSQNHQVLLVGDLVNKGPYSAEVVKYVREHNFLSIRGNHDDWALCQTLKLIPEYKLVNLDYLTQLTQEDIDWLSNLPYTISFPTWKLITVHAGLVPFLPLAQQTPTDMVTIRNLINHHTDDPNSYLGTSRNDQGVSWLDVWDGRLIEAEDADRWHVVFGHDARRGLQQTPYATGLDTGCAYGKELTAFVLPERKIVQVKARSAYTPISEKD